MFYRLFSLGLIYLFTANYTYSQNRESEYNEFIYNFKRIVTSFSLLDLTENEKLMKEIKSIQDPEQKMIVYNEWLKKQQDEYVAISMVVHNNFLIDKQKYGYEFRNKYLLQELASSEFPISTLHTKLENQDTSINKYSPRMKVYYTIVYLLQSMKYLDVTDTYNYTTVIIIKKAIYEMREYSFDEVEKYLY